MGILSAGAVIIWQQRRGIGQDSVRDWFDFIHMHTIMKYDNYCFSCQ